MFLLPSVLYPYYKLTKILLQKITQAFLKFPSPIILIVTFFRICFCISHKSNPFRLSRICLQWSTLILQNIWLFLSEEKWNSNLMSHIFAWFLYSILIYRQLFDKNFLSHVFETGNPLTDSVKNSVKPQQGTEGLYYYNIILTSNTR